MAHTIRDKGKLLARIRRIQGQAAGIEKALQGEADCMAVLQQIAAIRGAVSGLMNEVMEGHLRDHLGPDAEDADQREKDIDQIVGILKSYLK